MKNTVGRKMFVLALMIIFTLSLTSPGSGAINTDLSDTNIIIPPIEKPVKVCSSFNIVTQSLPPGQVGVYYSQQLKA